MFVLLILRIRVLEVLPWFPRFSHGPVWWVWVLPCYQVHSFTFAVTSHHFFSLMYKYIVSVEGGCVRVVSVVGSSMCADGWFLHLRSLRVLGVWVGPSPAGVACCMLVGSDHLGCAVLRRLWCSFACIRCSSQGCAVSIAKCAIAGLLHGTTILSQ